MLKIGDFSRLARVSVRMLRHYDQLGLLKPAQVDVTSGYRFYSADQLPRLNRILALQDLGFTLEQVGEVLRENVSAEQMRGMLRLKQAEVEQQIAAEQARLSRIAARLRAIDAETVESAYDVVVKTLPAQTVLAVRDTLTHYGAIGELYAQLYGALPPGLTVGMSGALLHDTEYREQGVDVEALLMLGQPPSASLPGLTTLPAVRALCVVHHGPYDTLGLAYDALLRALDARGETMPTPHREWFIATGDQPVTEIQIPLAEII